MGNEIVNRQVNIYIQSGDAQKTLDVLIKKEKLLKDQLVAATDPNIIKKLNTELSKLVEPIDRATKKLSGELKPSIRELEQTAKNLRNTMRNFSGSDADLSKLKLQIQGVNVELAEAKNRAESVQQSLSQKAGSGITSFLQGAGIGAGIATIEALGGAVKSFFDGAIEEARGAARQANALKATLTAAGEIDAFDRINDKANKLAQTFRFIDNDDFVGVFDQLITYGKLTEKQIDSLIPKITEYYSKERLAGNEAITLGEATETVIKALEGSAKGLKVYGVDMTNAKTTTERFGVIMDQLGPKVAGAGDAFANDFTGQLQTSEQEIKNIQEDIGGKLLPILTKLKLFGLNAFQGFVESFQVIDQAINGTINGIIQKTKDFFTSNDVLAARSLQSAKDAINEQSKAYGNTIASDAATKPLKEQQAILKSNLALYHASQGEYSKLVAQGKQNTEQGLAALKRVKEDLAVITSLNKTIALTKNTKTLGINNDDGKPKKTPKEKKAPENEYQDFINKLQSLNAKADEINLSQIDKEIEQNKQKYLELQRDFDKALLQKKLTQQQFDQLSIQAADLQGREQTLIIQKWAKEVNAAQEKLAKEDLKKAEERDQKRLQQAVESQVKLAQAVADQAQFNLGEYKSSLEFKQLVSRGKEKQAATRELLNFQEQMEITAAGNAQEKVKLIQEQYRQKRKSGEMQYYLDLAGQVVGFLSNLNSIFSSLAEAQTNKENAELERSTRINDKKKSNYESLYSKGILSRTEYDKKISELDKQQEAKEAAIRLKQFERNKRQSIIQANISIAESVLKALSSAPPPYSFILAGLAAAAGAVQLITIAKSKPPEYGKGGLLQGPSHQENHGMPVMNPRTGRPVAYVEGGEAMLSRATVANNPGIVGELLHTSMYRGGASIRPSWASQGPRPMNFGAIASSMGQVRMFEKGGILPGATSGADGGSVAAGFNQDQFNVLIAVLQETRPATVLLSDINNNQNRLDTIRSAATAKK